MKKLISTALALALCLSLCVPVLAADFSDVPASHTFYSSIMDCAGRGIVGGYNDGTFQPSKTVTRSNFSVMLSRAFYADTVATNQTQPAYADKGTFYPNFMALYTNGVYSGTDLASKNALQSADTMNTGISRYEMAQLMTNIMKRKGFAASDAEKNAAISKITDYSAIPSQFRDAVANVYALGIIGGYADGSFSGSGIMNRGQACVVIYRMMQYSGNTSSGSGNVPTPVPEVPAEPVATTAGTLADGSDATEANVMRLLEEAYQAKAGKAWGNGTSTTDAYPAGITSALYATITNGPRKGQGGLPTSVQAGCGGFAAYLSDYVFGQKAAVRETTLDKMRAGDVIINLLDNKIEHVMVYDGTTGTGVDIYGEPATEYGIYDASAGFTPNHVSNNAWQPNNGINTNYKGQTIGYVIYTRYPDSSSGNTSSGSGGITSPDPEPTAEPAATTTGTGTLADGAEATEANVMRLLEEAYQAKAGTAWGTPSTSTGQSTSAAYPDGNNSALYAVITNGQCRDSKGGNTSVVSGCGGFAAYLSDYVFGQKAAVRETTLDKMRAGDVILHLVDNQITHVNIYDGTTGTGTDIYGKTATEYGTYDANAGDEPGHTPNTSWHPNDGVTTDYKGRTIGYAIYTRYPA